MARRLCSKKFSSIMKKERASSFCDISLITAYSSSPVL